MDRYDYFIPNTFGNGLVHEAPTRNLLPELVQGCPVYCDKWEGDYRKLLIGSFSSGIMAHEHFTVIVVRYP